MAKILLVDDDQIESELIQMKLADAGHDVHIAEDGLIGPVRAESLQPDIIFLDFNLPGQTGADVYLKLKENPKTKTIPVVMATSMSRDHVFTAIGDGADCGYMQKPLDTAKMLDAVKKLCRPA